MKKNIRIVWTISIMIVSLSMIWFLLGSTACFQRSIDLVTTVIFMLVWVPSLWFVVLSFLALKKRWIPQKTLYQIFLMIAILVLTYVFSSIFLQSAGPYGWLKENVTEDYMQTTKDENYEYRLEIVNKFQKNSYARIYIKDISGGEEIKIPLDIPAREIYPVSGGVGSISPEPETPPVWSELTSTETEGIYTLTISDLFVDDVIYTYEINVEAKGAKRILK